MDMVSLSAQARKTDITPKNLRKEGNVPVVLYGNDTEHLDLQCEVREIMKAYAQAGGSTLVDLDANGSKVPSLFHAVDFDPVSDKIIHVDFYAVDMKKEIDTDEPELGLGYISCVNLNCGSNGGDNFEALVEKGIISD